MAGLRAPVRRGEVMSDAARDEELERRAAARRQRKNEEWQTAPSEREVQYPYRGFTPELHLRFETATRAGVTYDICHKFNGGDCQRARRGGLCYDQRNPDTRPPKAHACIMCGGWGHRCHDCPGGTRGGPRLPPAQLGPADLPRVMGMVAPARSGQERDARWSVQRARAADERRSRGWPDPSSASRR